MVALAVQPVVVHVQVAYVFLMRVHVGRKQLLVLVLVEGVMFLYLLKGSLM